jgi:hypothetical protein
LQDSRSYGLEGVPFIPSPAQNAVYERAFAKLLFVLVAEITKSMVCIAIIREGSSLGSNTSVGHVVWYTVTDHFEIFSNIVMLLTIRQVVFPNLRHRDLCSFKMQRSFKAFGKGIDDLSLRFVSGGKVIKGI